MTATAVPTDMSGNNSTELGQGTFQKSVSTASTITMMDKTTGVGTLLYIAPEQIPQSQRNKLFGIPKNNINQNIIKRDNNDGGGGGGGNDSNENKMMQDELNIHKKNGNINGNCDNKNYNNNQMMAYEPNMSPDNSDSSDSDDTNSPPQNKRKGKYLSACMCSVYVCCCIL